MTTITNFLESNFLDNPATTPSQQQTQSPIWVLNTTHPTPTLNQSSLKQYIITQATHSMKPLIHIDLGVSLVKKYPSAMFKSVVLESGLVVCMPNQGKPYIVVRSPVGKRVQNGFLQKLVQQINTLNESQVLKKLLTEINLAKKYDTKYSLLIQGIESMLLLNQTPQVQSFISHLSNLHPSIKQVTIFTQSSLMSKELVFSLERISTCLTTLTTWNGVEGVWECVSTVRRYTGYSNEEGYTMTVQRPSGRVKVAKKLNILDLNKQTKEQQEMVKSLGFVVKKQQKDKEQTEQLKRMIYPHLKMQERTYGCNCSTPLDCNNPSCKHQGEEDTDNPDQGLIILDDQQEDEDDVDV